jgi:hypothetical protein
VKRALIFVESALNRSFFRVFIVECRLQRDEIAR